MWAYIYTTRTQTFQQIPEGDRHESIQIHLCEIHHKQDVYVKGNLMRSNRTTSWWLSNRIPFDSLISQDCMFPLYYVKYRAWFLNCAFLIYILSSFLIKQSNYSLIEVSRPTSLKCSFTITICYPSARCLSGNLWNRPEMKADEHNQTTTMQVRSVCNKMMKTIGLMLVFDGIPSGLNPSNTPARPC